MWSKVRFAVYKAQALTEPNKPILKAPYSPLKPLLMSLKVTSQVGKLIRVKNFKNPRIKLGLIVLTLLLLIGDPVFYFQSSGLTKAQFGLWLRLGLVYP